VPHSPRLPPLTPTTSFPTASGDTSATLATHGITLPPGTTVAYTPLGTPPGADYHMTLTHTTSGTAACVAPSGVVKAACPLALRHGGGERRIARHGDSTKGACFGPLP
jgi:hypothetical protein